MRIRLLLAALAAATALVRPALAVVTVPTNTVTCLGTGAPMTCALPYSFQNNSDLVVTLAGATQTIGTHYTVSCAGCMTGGSVTMVQNPGNGVAIVVTRIVQNTQPTSFRTQGPFKPATFELALDWLEYQIQQSTSLGGPPTGNASGDLTLSYPNPNVASTHLVAPLPEVQGGTGAGALTCTGTQHLTSLAGSAYSCTADTGVAGNVSSTSPNTWSALQTFNSGQLLIPAPGGLSGPAAASWLLYRDGIFNVFLSGNGLNVPTTTTGQYNVGIGTAFLQSIGGTTSTGNIAIGGAGPLSSIQGGNYNVSVGHGSGTGYGNTSNNNVLVGLSAGMQTAGSVASNQICIGANCVPGAGVVADTVSNTATIGGAAITNTYLKGIVNAPTFTGTGVPAFTSSGTGSVDFSGASGVFKTTTGAITLGPGAISNAPLFGAGLTASGAVANDFSGSTGAFKTSTGAVTLGPGTTTTGPLTIGAVGTPITGSPRGVSGTITTASVPAGTVATVAAISVSGAVAGAECVIGLPAAVTTVVTYACVTSTNLCTVYAQNASAGAANYLGGVYSCRTFNP